MFNNKKSEYDPKSKIKIYKGQISLFENNPRNKPLLPTMICRKIETIQIEKMAITDKVEPMGREWKVVGREMHRFIYVSQTDRMVVHDCGCVHRFIYVHQTKK